MAREIIFYFIMDLNKDYPLYEDLSFSSCIIVFFVQTQGDHFVLHYVARILEMVVPLMDHPSETFLAQLEMDMMKLILKHGMMVNISLLTHVNVLLNSQCIFHMRVVYLTLSLFLNVY